MAVQFTDLALEAHEAAGEIRGVDFKQETPMQGVTISRVKVMTPEGANAMGKPIGNYITIEVPGLKLGDPQLHAEVSKILAAEIKKMIPQGPGPALVVGLGNWNVTPDSLGPKTVGQTLATRHMIQIMPEQIDKRLRPVCTIAPGVLGTTGIESGEIVKGVVDNVRPKVVIAIDSLASLKTERIGTSIQLADTGISPGGGIGNRRPGLSQENLGVPVLAIGIPLVVYAATIVADAVEATLKENLVYKNTGGLQDVKNAAQNNMGNLVVTPKEIDGLIDDTSKVVADSLNLALHDNMSLEEIRMYM